MKHDLTPQWTVYLKLRTFRVNIDDSTSKVLPIAFANYNISGDWRNYAIYIVHEDTERCLGLDEKPLILFRKLVGEGRKPMFLLRKHAAPKQGTISILRGSRMPANIIPGGLI
jgi:hypothetical protein